MVVATRPDTFAVLTEPFRGPVRFEFDERISERVASGTLDQAAVVSPRTGRVRVGHGRQSIEVNLDGGFRPGLVYRVTLLPVVRDLFNNQLMAPFEVVFSTGGAYNASAVAGTAWDRVTADGVEALEVVAIAEEAGDSVPYVARTDTAGVYVFRYLPTGSYRVTAFQDRNRNGIVDPMELQGRAGFEVGGPDTLFVDVAVLQPDTTPPRLTRASVMDSLTLLLEFDDYLDPQVGAGSMGVTLTNDSTGALVPMRVLHERDYVAWARQLADSFAALDSIEARARAEAALEEVPLGRDTLRPDTARGDTVRARVPRRPGVAPAPSRTTRPLPPALPVSASGGGRPTPGARPGQGAEEVLAPDGRPLPSRRLVLRLDEFLPVSVKHTVFAGSVVNIAGTGGGGGETVVVREPPKDTTKADSAAARDTVPPDTMAVPPDTIPPDTMAAPRGAGRVGSRILLFLAERRTSWPARSAAASARCRT